jgi:hypothetical protein
VTHASYGFLVALIADIRRGETTTLGKKLAEKGKSK